jgi:hypothetical protein
MQVQLQPKQSAISLTFIIAVVQSTPKIRTDLLCGGAGTGLTWCDIPSRHLPGGTEEKRDKISCRGFEGQDFRTSKYFYFSP